MRIFLKILVALGLLLSRVGDVQAQLNNQAFVEAYPGRRAAIRLLGHPSHGYGPSTAARRPDERDSTGQVLLALNAFTFFKDNEYFNPLLDGRTLLGTHFNPQLVYYPVNGLRLEAGVFLWKDFGNPVFQQVRPTYRATWTVKRNEFILGNIRPHLHHDYIEPLFNFERVMLNPLEEGVQYRYRGRRLLLDTWVDWQRQQYRFSPYQEELVGGLSSRFALTRAESALQVVVPFQFTATHSGGNDTLVKPLQTLFNEAIGVEARQVLGNRRHALRFNGYVVGFQDNSPVRGQLPFRYGRGLYANATLETPYGEVMMGYWYGQSYLARLGGDFYQGVAHTVGGPRFIDRNRRLLLVRLLRDFRIADAAALTVRVEPVYDVSIQLLDFSAAVYLNFRQEWLLGNVGQRVRGGP